MFQATRTAGEPKRTARKSFGTRWIVPWEIEALDIPVLYQVGIIFSNVVPLRGKTLPQSVLPNSLTLITAGRSALVFFLEGKKTSLRWVLRYETEAVQFYLGHESLSKFVRLRLQTY